MALSREDFLKMPNHTTKKITVPEKILGWAGQELFIRQLSRGDQDQFLKRQFGDGMVRAGHTEYDMAGLYGHDSWVCARGICNENGERIFTDDDAKEIDNKSGEFIGWAAIEILTFSGMKKDVDDAKKAAKAQKEELKN